MFMKPDEIARFIKDGMDPAERVVICAQMNLCKIAEIKEICRMYGVEIPKRTHTVGRKSKWTDTMLDKLRKEWKSGKSVQELADMFHISKDSMYYTLKKYIKNAPDAATPEAAGLTC